MQYQEFVCAVEKKMNKKMEGGMKASLHKTVKNNGTERTGLMIETPGKNIFPTIYLEEFYERFQKIKGACNLKYADSENSKLKYELNK